MKTQANNSAKKVMVTFMIVLTVSVMNIANAQGISGFVAMLSPVNAMNSTTVEKMAVLVNEELNDDELKVEDWMSNDNYWRVSEQDEQLEVEDWMSSENYWGVKEQANFSDSPLTVENWMSSDSYWTGGQQEKDDNLAIESWMTSNEYWGMK
ncbi:hypothetical protein [Prolixibacter denitrificans]|uniref:Uncharacterized protein n=1 Tax=Prolixibacter denitrificans TaxID=1541063 RepID=A0A2P8C966_9BACT|nr:hypothetical protein [Prolixibacter denitrificans]PSK81506.1 hypothetical protein CLV93_109112 [Prolixibacter denitrificans]GET21026.1 hypothetical protein JCM18694_12720 [Prolixibacter denitrificans]